MGCHALLAGTPSQLYSSKLVLQEKVFEITLGKEGDQLTYECKVALHLQDLCAEDQAGKGVLPPFTLSQHLTQFCGHFRLHL